MHRLPSNLHILSVLAVEVWRIVLELLVLLILDVQISSLGWEPVQSQNFTLCIMDSLLGLSLVPLDLHLASHLHILLLVDELLSIFELLLLGAQCTNQIPFGLTHSKLASVCILLAWAAQFVACIHLLLQWVFVISCASLQLRLIVGSVVDLDGLKVIFHLLRQASTLAGRVWSIWLHLSTRMLHGLRLTLVGRRRIVARGSWISIEILPGSGCIDIGEHLRALLRIQGLLSYIHKWGWGEQAWIWLSIAIVVSYLPFLEFTCQHTTCHLGQRRKTCLVMHTHITLLLVVLLVAC